MRADAERFLAEHRATRVEPITERLVRTIVTENPGYRAAGVVPTQDLVESCRANVQRVLELLAAWLEEGVPRDHLDAMYDAARATGRRRAEQGLPLDDVLRSFRLGGRLIWDDLIDQGSERLGLDDLRDVGSRLWEVVDETSAQVAAEYHAAEMATVRADEQLRGELWDGVLAGRLQDPGFAREAAGILDLPLSGPYVAASLEGVDPRRVALVVAEAEPRWSSTWTRRSGAVLGLVAPTADAGRDPAARLGAVLAPLEVPVGLSAVVPALGDVPVALRQAGVAVRASAGRPGVASFDDRLPEALLLTAPEVARRLVGLWLAPVLALPAGERTLLLDTLRAWVATAGSTATTAERVHCHRNTVINRLRRVSDLLGRDLGGAPPVELDLALRALDAAVDGRPRGARGA